MRKKAMFHRGKRKFYISRVRKYMNLKKKRKKKCNHQRNLERMLRNLMKVMKLTMVRVMQIHQVRKKHLRKKI